MKFIRSRDNPRVKALIRLAASSRDRRRTGTTLIEGENLLRAYQASGGVAEIVFAGESAAARPEIRTLVENMPAATRVLLADRIIEHISQLASVAGVAAVIRTPEPGPWPRELSTCLLLENIQDPGNLGSMLRCAAAAGMRHVFLSRGSVFAWAPKVVRAAMGAHFLVSIFEDIDLDSTMRGFRGRIVATEPRAPASLYDLDLSGPVAWMFGNEGAGLSERALSAATDRVRIPLAGAVESLNVAAAVAICLFEQVRQKTGAGDRRMAG